MQNSKNQSYLPPALPSKDLSFLSRMERGRDCINHVFSTQKRVKKKVKKKTQVGGCSQESGEHNDPRPKVHFSRRPYYAMPFKGLQVYHLGVVALEGREKIPPAACVLRGKIFFFFFEWKSRFQQLNLGSSSC